MAKARGWFVRGLGLVIVLVMALATVGCWDDDDTKNGAEEERAQASVCQLRVAAGDGDCDGVANRYDQAPDRDDFRVDSDGDRVVDGLDRFQGLRDFGDRDRDGWANWADPYPTNWMGGPGTPLAGPRTQAEQAARQAFARRLTPQLVTETERLRDENMKLEFLNQQLARRLLKDRDMDRISDIYDAQPNLHFGNDADRDGTVNGRDKFPYDPTNN